MTLSFCPQGGKFGPVLASCPVSGVDRIETRDRLFLTLHDHPTALDGLLRKIGVESMRSTYEG